jgi:hypothetical protein
MPFRPNPEELSRALRFWCRCTIGVGSAAAFRALLNYLIDIENAVIVDVEATPTRTYDEVAAARTMVERTEQRMWLKPQKSVLASAGSELHIIAAWSLLGKFDGEFAAGSQTYAGSGTLRYQW